MTALLTLQGESSASNLERDNRTSRSAGWLVAWRRWREESILPLTRAAYTETDLVRSLQTQTARRRNFRRERLAPFGDQSRARKDQQFRILCYFAWSRSLPARIGQQLFIACATAAAEMWNCDTPFQPQTHNGTRCRLVFARII